MSDDYLTFKWGTLKDWRITDPRVIDLLDKWIALGVSVSSMMQKSRDTPEHLAALCAIIDAHTGTIDNDWEGTTMTKDEAKQYIMEYR